FNSLVRQRCGVLEGADESRTGRVHRDRQNDVARFLVVANHRHIDSLIEKGEIGANFKLFLQLGTQRWIAESGAAGYAGDAANRAAQNVTITRSELDYGAQCVERGIDVRLTTGLTVSRAQLAKAEQAGLIRAVEQVAERPGR